MIKIQKQPEIISFDQLVRKPGNKFLKKNPSPTSIEWANHSYWSKIGNDFYNAYSGICAYTGMWFSLSISDVSIDHFLPKSQYPKLAYEWDNYRLTTIKMNRNKGIHKIADPFKIGNDWFNLEIPTCLVKPSVTLTKTQSDLVLETIRVLKLNSDDNIVSERLNVIKEYVYGHIDLDFMMRKYPFIAKELKRQNITENVGDYFSFNLNSRADYI